MNKKYIDFVPVQPKEKKSAAKSTASKARVRSTEVTELEISEMFDAREVKPRAGVTISSSKSTKSVAAAPRARFVNTEKVAKRPLSKNVYAKKIPVVPKEEKPLAPVKIIDKPEKDSKVGLIMTVIITIILGAAAGTVAFLLLPK